jgi:hypothetical protein
MVRKFPAVPCNRPNIVLFHETIPLKEAIAFSATGSLTINLLSVLHKNRTAIAMSWIFHKLCPSIEVQK